MSAYAIVLISSAMSCSTQACDRRRSADACLSRDSLHACITDLLLPFRALKCCLDFNSLGHKFMACHFQALRNLAAWLRTGRIDVCLFPLPLDDSEGLALEPLVDEDCVIVLPQAHALANSATVPLARLAKETFILCGREFSPAMFNSILTACSRAGFRPKLGRQVPQALAVIPMVAAGFGVSIIPRSFSQFRFAGVNYIDFESDVPRSAIALAFRRDERSATIVNVMKAARLAKLDATSFGEAFCYAVSALGT